MQSSALPIFFPFQIRFCRKLRLFSMAAAFWSLLSVPLLATGSDPELAKAQSHADRSVAKAYVDDNSRLHIVYNDGRDIRPPTEKGQVNCNSVRVADDGETVGWLAEFPNCCTSYPVALNLVIWRSGKIVYRLGNGMLIANWNFVGGGRQAAFYTNTVHGDFSPHYELRDLRTGRQVAKWDGPLTNEAPSWARELSK